VSRAFRTNCSWCLQSPVFRYWLRVDCRGGQVTKPRFTGDCRQGLTPPKSTLPRDRMIPPGSCFIPYCFGRKWLLWQSIERSLPEQRLVYLSREFERDRYRVPTSLPDHTCSQCPSSRQEGRCQARPSRSPGWSANVTDPGTKLYPCPATGRQRAAFDGKPGKGRFCCTLPFEGAQQMSDCFHASSESHGGLL
jgi:hypothetical protein